MSLNWQQAQCKFTAIMLHYFYLVSFAWMLCEGFHLYAMIVKVFNLTSRIYHFVAFAWGKPTSLFTLTDLFVIHISCFLLIHRIHNGRAEKRFLAFQNKGSFWYLSSIFCKQTLLVAMNKTSNNGNILRRRTRDIKPCTLGEVLF